MVFGFLAVVADVFVFSEQLVPGYGHAGHERNALVGWSEDHVEGHRGLLDSSRIAANQQGSSRVWRENGGSLRV